MVGPNIRPAEALQDGCGATVVAHERQENEYGAWCVAYRLIALPALGWKFTGINYSYLQHFSDGTSLSGTSSLSPDLKSPNTSTGTCDWDSAKFCEWHDDSWGAPSYGNITGLSATFEPIVSRLYVIATASGDGTVSPQTQTVTCQVGKSKGYYITAHANQGSRFVKWVDSSGEEISRDETLHRTFSPREESSTSESIVFTAVFEVVEYKLTVIAVATAGGSVNPERKTETGSVGTSKTFTLSATANQGCRFVSWTDETGAIVSRSADYSFDKKILAGDTTYTYTANFEIGIEVVATPTSGGSTNPQSQTKYGQLGESIPFVVSAEPNQGCRFKKWLRDGVEISTDQQYSFSVVVESTQGSTIELEAVFEIGVTVETSVEGSGSSSPVSETKFGVEGEKLSFTIVATADAGWLFVKWTSGGSDVSTSQSYTFDKYAGSDPETFSYIAHFVQEAPTKRKITVETLPSPSTYGNTSPRTQTQEGYKGERATFTIVAKPNLGHRFKQWQKGTSIVKQRTYTFEEEFGDTDRTIRWIGIFEEGTGLILRDPQSGKILRGSNGKILRDA